MPANRCGIGGSLPLIRKNRADGGPSARGTVDEIVRGEAAAAYFVARAFGAAAVFGRSSFSSR